MADVAHESSRSSGAVLQPLRVLWLFLSFVKLVLGEVSWVQWMDPREKKWKHLYTGYREPMGTTAFAIEFGGWIFCMNLGFSNSGIGVVVLSWGYVVIFSGISDPFLKLASKNGLATVISRTNQAVLINSSHGLWAHVSPHSKKLIKGYITPSFRANTLTVLG